MDVSIVVQLLVRDGNKAVTLATNVLYNCWISDVMTCHKAMRTELFRSLPLRERGFAIEPEIAARVLRSGERIHEVPISYGARGREAGKKLDGGRRAPRPAHAHRCRVTDRTQSTRRDRLGVRVLGATLLWSRTLRARTTRVLLRRDPHRRRLRRGPVRTTILGGPVVPNNHELCSLRVGDARRSRRVGDRAQLWSRFPFLARRRGRHGCGYTGGSGRSPPSSFSSS